MIIGFKKGKEGGNEIYRKRKKCQELGCREACEERFSYLRLSRKFQKKFLRKPEVSLSLLRRSSPFFLNVGLQRTEAGSLCFVKGKELDLNVLG